jgi:plastocyanin
MKLRMTLATLILAVPLGGTAPSSAATIKLDVSNFRYCAAAPCLPTDFVYVRNPTGNGMIWDNALAATLVFRTEVHPGDTVTWTYKDALCDAISGCPGHAVCFENGTAEGDCGTRILGARKGAVSVSFTVPTNTKNRTLLRYFCNVNSHFVFGMTGTLLVKK